ncbi:MAG TPA: hypothetical protein DEA96_05715 [Leptospiraceae bacterium]|nr:hypothetical protein [Spirochaetaceae bacterium]HBS04440.1 hypothetical protein [Leptospiraceae bacterium]|tara:strand:- start:3970 stop:5016 length:1047 start_codon:yes stop_codon:yes gene_type:complete
MVALRRIQRLVGLVLVVALMPRCLIEVVRTDPVEIGREIVSNAIVEPMQLAADVRVAIKGEMVSIQWVLKPHQGPLMERKELVTYQIDGDYRPTDLNGWPISWPDYWLRYILFGGIGTMGMLWIGAIGDWSSLPFRLPESQKEVREVTMRTRLPIESGNQVPPVNQIIISHPRLEGRPVLDISDLESKNSIRIPIDKLLNGVAYELDRYRVHFYGSGKELNVTSGDIISLLSPEASDPRIEEHLRAFQLLLLRDLRTNLDEILDEPWPNSPEHGAAVRLMAVTVYDLYARYLRPTSGAERIFANEFEEWANTVQVRNIHQLTRRLQESLDAAIDRIQKDRGMDSSDLP